MSPCSMVLVMGNAKHSFIHHQFRNTFILPAFQPLIKCKCNNRQMTVCPTKRPMHCNVCTRKSRSKRMVERVRVERTRIHLGYRLKRRRV